MKNLISIQAGVFFLSLCVLAAVVMVTFTWHDVVYVQRDTWSALIFRVLAGFVGFGSLVLVAIPSGLLYRRKRRRLDLASLCIAIICILVLCVELFVLHSAYLKPGPPC